MGYIRDLAGYKNSEGQVIKPNFLIRSAQLDKPTEQQLEYLKSIGLKRIYDLRNEDEAAYDPDVEIEGATYRNYSYIDADLNGITHQKRKEKLAMLKIMPIIEENYIGMVSDDFSLNAIRKTIREIVLIHDYPTLFHCVTGKDRVGVTAALLLYILKVPYETIVYDYCRQRKYYIAKAYKLGILAFLMTFDKTQAKKAYDYYAVNRRCIDVTFETINKNFGSVDNFIKDYIGLSDKQLDTFRKIVLE